MTTLKMPTRAILTVPISILLAHSDSNDTESDNSPKLCLIVSDKVKLLPHINKNSGRKGFQEVTNTEKVAG